MITQSSRLPFHLLKGDQIGQASSRVLKMTSLPTCFQTEGYILFQILIIGRCETSETVVHNQATSQFAVRAALDYEPLNATHSE